MHLLHQIAGVEQIGFTRSGRCAAHINAACSAFGAQHGCAACGAAAVGEVAHLQTFDAADMPFVIEQVLDGGDGWHVKTFGEMAEMMLQFLYFYMDKQMDFYS